MVISEFPTFYLSWKISFYLICLPIWEMVCEMVCESKKKKYVCNDAFDGERPDHKFYYV